MKGSFIITNFHYDWSTSIFIVREPGDMVSKGADKMVASTQDIYAGNFLIFY